MKKNGVQSIVLFLLLLCVPLQYVVAQTAGDKGITMEFKDEQLPSVFKRLEKISKYRVLFTYDDLSSYKATGKVENATIEQTLKAIIGDKPLKYHIDGQFINVTLKTERGNKKTIAKVRGKVISAEDGEPVIGASIMVEGTTTGTTTDLDGNFEFSEVPSNAYLKISFIGMESQRLKVSGQMNISMKTDAMALSDVVVTGYYTQRKTTFTGAATSYSGEELRAVSDQNVLATIAALDPSFKLVDNIAMGSDPNTIPDIQVRGMNSLPNTDVTNLNEEYKGKSNLPTFILDGFEVSVEKI